MRIGLVSDTHGRLRPEVLERLAGVDRILHAGDVGNDEILVELGALAEVTAVWGNVDDFAVRQRTTEVADLILEGANVIVVHGHQLGSPTPGKLREVYPRADVIVFGHTHQATLDESEGRIVVNPGAAGPARFRTTPSVAVLELDGPARRVAFHRL